MAVPKKRVGHSAQGHRRSNWKATVPETTTCQNCGELVLTHTVCTACGYYKGKPVSIKAEGAVQTVEEPKELKPKKAKKTKTEEVVETKTEATVETSEEVVDEKPASEEE
jgi:large subunit ribosomal protein L32